MRSNNRSSNSIRNAIFLFGAGFLTFFFAQRNTRGNSTHASHIENHAALAARPPIVLATGLPDGDYIRLGHAIAHVAADWGLNIQVCSSQGSKQNLEYLKNEKSGITFALVQSDALHEEVFHASGEGSDDRPISLISYLYSEKVHLVLKPHFYLSSLSDLRQMEDKVWLGPKGSGSRATTVRILEAAGLTEKEINRLGERSENSWADAKNDLVSGGLQAFFRTRSTPPKNMVSHPVRVPENIPSCDHREVATKHVEKKGEANADPEVDPIQDLLSKDARLVGLGPEIIDRITEDGLYDRSAIPLATYPNLKRGVPTISLSTALVTSEGRNDPVATELIRELVDIIKENRPDIEHQLGGIPLELLDTSLNKEDAMKWENHIHRGAHDHLIPATSWQVMGIQGSALACVALLLLFPKARKMARYVLAKGIYPILLLTIMAGLWFAFSYGMVLAEGQFNLDFQTVFSSMRKMLAYVSGWSGGKDTITPQGRTILYLAVFVVPLVFGWLTSDVIHRSVEKAADKLSETLARNSERHSGGQKNASMRKWIRRVFGKGGAAGSQAMNPGATD